MESILRYSTETPVPHDSWEVRRKATQTLYCRYWSREEGDKHEHRAKCTTPIWVICRTCGYETEAGVPCGLPCV